LRAYKLALLRRFGFLPHLHQPLKLLSPSGDGLLRSGVK